MEELGEVGCVLGDDVLDEDGVVGGNLEIVDGVDFLWVIGCTDVMYLNPEGRSSR